MYLIPENFQIIRRKNDEAVTTTTYKLTKHLHQMGILSSAVKMDSISHCWESALEKTDNMEFEGNENFFVIALQSFFADLKPEQMEMVCQYIVANWLNHDEEVLIQSQIEKKVTFLN